MDKALATVMDQITPLPSVKQPVNEALIGAVLDEDIMAAEAIPGYRASILDGYAVIGMQDVWAVCNFQYLYISPHGVNLLLTHEKWSFFFFCGGCIIDTDGPGEYPVTAVSIATASEGGVAKLLPGQIARITTGGAVPEGATAVVMVEDTQLIKSSEDGTREEIVKILAKVRSGEAIREIGSDVQVGQTVLRKGQVVSAVGGEIGVMASIGVRNVGSRTEWMHS
jgi:gephyrin